MATRNVVLTDSQDEWVNGLVRSGRFQNASEALRAGLRLLEVEEEKLRHLRAAIDAGDASGPAEPFDFDAFLERKSAERRGEG